MRWDKNMKKVEAFCAWVKPRYVLLLLLLQQHV